MVMQRYMERDVPPPIMTQPPQGHILCNEMAMRVKNGGSVIESRLTLPWRHTSGTDQALPTVSGVALSGL